LYFPSISRSEKNTAETLNFQSRFPIKRHAQIVPDEEAALLGAGVLGMMVMV
jgi:hypothetical protein